MTDFARRGGGGGGGGTWKKEKQEREVKGDEKEEKMKDEKKGRKGRRRIARTRRRERRRRREERRRREGHRGGEERGTKARYIDRGGYIYRRPGERLLAPCLSACVTIPQTHTVPSYHVSLGVMSPTPVPTMTIPTVLTPSPSRFKLTKDHMHDGTPHIVSQKTICMMGPSKTSCPKARWSARSSRESRQRWERECRTHRCSELDSGFGACAS